MSGMQMYTGSSDLPFFLARFLAEKSQLKSSDKERFQEICERLVQAMEEGNSCLPVNPKEEEILLAAAVVAAGGSVPLIVCNGKVYLQRYFNYERRLARQCAALSQRSSPVQHSSELIATVSDGKKRDTYQEKAMEIALNHALCIISGGPGTGKTSTVVKILALLVKVLGKKLRIALCAPTGKAAMRLQESVQEKKEQLSIEPELKECIPETASTLHRLLGTVQYSPQFHYSGKNPLPWDVVIVDEASMVDLALLSKLVDALHPQARLILLGDQDQLVSVEAGSVLADLIRIFPERTVLLQTTYRFNETIKNLAQAIHRGELEQVEMIVNDPQLADAQFLTEDLDEFIGSRFCFYMEKVQNYPSISMAEIFSAFRSFLVLCANRLGARGVDGINSRVESYLRRKGYAVQSEMWYSGRPVLITRNDYNLEIYNGDIGICLPDPEGGSPKIWFERQRGTFTGFYPSRLPAGETAFAVTIHKSQGSECDDVVIVLPDDENKLLSRELIYTAVTRARKSVSLDTTSTILRSALAARAVRHSGLADNFTMYTEEETDA